MKKIIILLAGAMLMMSTSAMATQITAINISATGASSPVTVYDGSTTLGSADLSNTPGIVSWAGTLGNFIFTLNAGSTNPAIGSAAVPKMHLNGFANTGNAGGLFTVMFSSTDFGPMSNGLTGFISSMNGADGVQSLDVFFDKNNNLFAQTTQIADINTINTLDVYNGIPENDPFSLTMVASILLGPRSAASFDNTVTPVPEPGTMMLLGAGFLGLAIYGKRRKNV